MTFDEQLRRNFEALAARVREETDRQLAAVTAELRETIDAERSRAAAQAATEAKNVAEKEALAQLNAIVAATEARGRDAANRAAAKARETGLAEGREEGREQGKRDGLEQGRREGHEEGHRAGIEEGRKAGWESGVEEGRNQGRQEGKQEGKEEGLAEGLQQGRREGRAEGLEIGKEEGRAEGKLEGKLEGKEEGREEGRDEGRVQGRAEGFEEGRRAGLDEAGQSNEETARAAELAAGERLIESIRAIDAARSLTEVLDALASAAGREAARVAVLLLRSGNLRGWRFIGFGHPLDEQHDVELTAADAGAIAEAARTGAAVSADSAAAASVPSFAELPGGRELLAVPVQMSGQVVAVLYADQGAEGPSQTLAWPSRLELMARHAARCLEAITAFRAAQVLTERPDVPAGSSGAAAGQGDSGENMNNEQAARRYARLLVSEIKLYHESAVTAGRRERDLATRLGGEIARARVLYEQRVPKDARGGSDYFLEELVRTLADGDAGLLKVSN